MTNNQEVQTTVHVPEPIGYWVLPGSNDQGGIRFHIYEKPYWVHRMFMRILMGWGYEDL